MPSIIKTKLELHARSAAIAVCAAVLLRPADAQEEGLTVEVGECIDLPTPEQRLACFEAQVEAVRRARGSSDAAPAAPASEPAAPGRAAEPGRVAESPRPVQPAPRAAEAPPRPVEPAPRAAEPTQRAAAPAPRAVPPEAAPAPPAEPAPRVVEARVRPEPQRAAPEQGATADDDDRRLNRRQQERAERLANPEIFATVAELRETVPNSYLITLDNGQVWRQTVPMAYGLREGAEVHLYPSRWGDSYRLTDENLRGYIQVERVR